MTTHGDDSAAEEAIWVAQARAGNADAFARLCERHRRRVWRVVASATPVAADAEDLAQEAIVRAFCALSTYRAEASFVAWLCHIALNVAHDHGRSAWKRRVLLWPQGLLPAGEETGHAPAPESEMARRDVQRQVRAAVATLPARERVPIWLVYFEEFSLAEVARLENVPESTLRSRIRAGLKRLGRVLPADLLTGQGEENAPVNTSGSVRAASGTPASSLSVAVKGCKP